MIFPKIQQPLVDSHGYLTMSVNLDVKVSIKHPLQQEKESLGLLFGSSYYPIKL